MPTRRKLLRRFGLFSSAIVLSATARRRVSPPGPQAASTAAPRPLSLIPPAVAAPSPHRVVVISTTDRAAGVQQAMALLQPASFSGKSVFIKPNYNTGDPAPAATDPAVLETVVQQVQQAGASRITVGDRSGMAPTRSAMAQMQVFALAERYGFTPLVFDELGRDGWQYFPAAGTNWTRGYAIAKPVLDADAIISLCCLKTHRFGGHFTLSLKNTIGMVARYVPGDGHDYMRELHRSGNQRLMIAEVNQAYRPAMVLIDGVEAFVGGGPEQGQRVRAGVMLAGTDRVAVDAVGIALLRMLGTTQTVSQGSIWSQAQIRRAADLGLGAVGPEQIEFVTGDAAGDRLVAQLKPFLV